MDLGPLYVPDDDHCWFGAAHQPRRSAGLARQGGTGGCRQGIFWPLWFQSNPVSSSTLWTSCSLWQVPLQVVQGINWPLESKWMAAWQIINWWAAWYELNEGIAPPIEYLLSKSQYNLLGGIFLGFTPNSVGTLTNFQNTPGRIHGDLCLHFQQAMIFHYFTAANTHLLLTHCRSIFVAATNTRSP